MGKNRDHSKFPNAITVLDNGNVGIGNTNPSTTLHISTTNGIRLQYPGNTGYTQFSTDGTNAYIFSGYDGERMRITSAGNVGIGNTNPFAGATTLTGLAISDRGGLFKLAVNDVVYLSNNLYYDGANWKRITANGGMFMQLESVDGGTLRVFSAATGSAGSNATTFDRLMINSSGNIGIGTGSPNHKLSIVDSGYNQYSLRLESQSGNTANRWGGIGFAGEGSNTKAGIFFVSEGGSYSRGNLVFANNSDFNQNSATPSDARMSITKEGYITKPNQPSFYATSTAGSTAYGSGEVIVFNSTRHNIGSHYNTSNGRFTAPVAGRYLFSVNVYAYGGYQTALTLTINGAQYTVQDLSPYLFVGSEVGNITDGFTLIWDLAAGDYIELRCRVGNYAQIYRAHSHFSGQLLS